MKKVQIALLASLTAASVSVSADTLMGAEIELNAWSQDSTYKGADAGSNVDWTFEAAFEHLIPLVPNVRYSRSTVESDHLEYNKQDITLYYEIFDNSLISADVGAGITSLSDGMLDIIGRPSFEGSYPHVHGAAELGLPGTSISLFLRGNGIAIEDVSATDFNVGIKNTMSLGLVDIDLQLGYRVHSFYLEDFDDLPVAFDAKIDGAYVGVNLDF